MQLVSGDELEITGELNEMFDQVKQTVTEQYKRNNILEKLKRCGFIVNFEHGDHQINDELGIIYAYK